MKLPSARFNPKTLTRILRSRSATPRKAPGLPPGSLVHVGEQRVAEARLRIVTFDTRRVVEDHPSAAEASARAADLVPASPAATTWIEVTGLHDTGTIARLGTAFGLHPLLIEDILNTESHPKVEISPDAVFVITRLITLEPKSHQADIQHVALVLLPGNVVLLFLEAETTAFAPVRRRIDDAGGRLRAAGADYLAWALVDAIFDHYHAVIDRIDEDLLALEDRLGEDSGAVEAAEIHFARREVASLHRTVRPAREIASALLRGESPLLTAAVRPFLRDLYDHAIHVVVRSEDLRDTAGSIRDFYLTSASNRMNEVMKILTAIATIFLPLTFIAGIYGMNFAHMPELGLSWAYPAVWGVFVLVALGMVLWFRRRRWF